MRRSARRGAVLLALAATLAAPATAAAQRTFGVYVDPWHVAEWAHTVGIAPQSVARFEAWSRNATVDSFLREAERQGLRRVLVTWEPWRPVPAELGVLEQFRAHPGYRNRDMTSGSCGRRTRACSCRTGPGATACACTGPAAATWTPSARR